MVRRLRRLRRLWLGYSIRGDSRRLCLQRIGNPPGSFLGDAVGEREAVHQDLLAVMGVGALHARGLSSFRACAKVGGPCIA